MYLNQNNCVCTQIGYHCGQRHSNRRAYLYKDNNGTYRKTAVTPLLTYWSYCSLALSHRYSGMTYMSAIKLACHAPWISRSSSWGFSGSFSKFLLASILRRYKACVYISISMLTLVRHASAYYVSGRQLSLYQQHQNSWNVLRMLTIYSLWWYFSAFNF